MSAIHLRLIFMTVRGSWKKLRGAPAYFLQKMAKHCQYSEVLFEEALHHSRNGTLLRNTIVDNFSDISKYKNESFESVFADVYRVCKPIRGLGMLTTYDLSSSICRKHGKNIDRVYIIGNGPKRAVKLLKLTPKLQRIGGVVTLHYVEIADIVAAFDKGGYKLDDTIRTTKNGDMVESFICNWQKGI